MSLSFILQVALLFAVPRSKTVKALTNCELNVLSKTKLDMVLKHFPQFKDKMITVAEVCVCIFCNEIKLFQFQHTFA